MKKIQALLIAICCIGSSINAQEAKNFGLTRATFETRYSYHYDNIDGDVRKDASGFKGNYLQLLLSGDINEKWHFDYRQKFNKYSADYTFFDATDKLLVIYTPTDQWSIKIGKRPLSMGGCDYAIIPIDYYLSGEYLENLSLYWWGISGTYFTKDKSDAFSIEVIQSPFRNYSTDKNIYAYSGIWEGSHGCVDFLHSVHFYGTETGKYVNWIMLGHRFNLDKFIIEADVLNRYSLAGKDAKANNSFFFQDFSLVGKVKYNPSEQFSFAVKYCYDTNKCKYESPAQETLENCDYLVLPGTEVNRLGGIFEYYPLKGIDRNTLRFHFAGYYDWGTNTNINGNLLDGHAFLSIGVTLKYSLLNK